MTKFTPTNTHARAVIHRHGRVALALSGTGTGTDAIGGGSAFLIAATYQKSIAGQGRSLAGTFTLTIKASAGFDPVAEIQCGDWVVLSWSLNGVPSVGTTGIVVGVSEARASSSGATNRMFTVSCQDFGRIFDLTSVWFNEYEGQGGNAGGRVVGSRFGFLPGGPPDFVVETIVSAFLGKEGTRGGVWRMPDATLARGFTQGDLARTPTFVDNFLRVVVQDGFSRQKRRPVSNSTIPTTSNPAEIHLRGEKFDEVSLWQPQPGVTLSQVLWNWSNPILNEMYADVLTDNDADGDSAINDPLPALIIRERPFVNASLGGGSPWFRLQTNFVARDEILSSKLSTTDDERINLILVYAALVGVTAFEQYIVHPPIINDSSVLRYGIRRLEEASLYAGTGALTGNLATSFILGGVRALLTTTLTGSTTWEEEIAQWVALLASWHGPNHLWRSGSITFPRLRPEIRIGSRLVIGSPDPKSSDREQFYVESVQHNWRYPAGGQTTVGVTRGFRGSDPDLIGMVAAEAGRFAVASGEDTPNGPEP